MATASMEGARPCARRRMPADVAVPKGVRRRESTETRLHAELAGWVS